jgi:hypothetical protein
MMQYPILQCPSSYSCCCYCAIIPQDQIGTSHGNGNINHQVQFAPSNGTTTAPASGSAALRPMKRRPPTVTLPCVDAIEKHELMLLRMRGNAKSQMVEYILWSILNIILLYIFFYFYLCRILEEFFLLVQKFLYIYY